MHLTPALLLWVESVRPGEAETWLTLSDVSLGETSDGASDGDLLQVATPHHLQAPCSRVFLHDVHHLTLV